MIFDELSRVQFRGVETWGVSVVWARSGEFGVRVWVRAFCVTRRIVWQIEKTHCVPTGGRHARAHLIWSHENEPLWAGHSPRQKKTGTGKATRPGCSTRVRVIGGERARGSTLRRFALATGLELLRTKHSS